MSKEPREITARLCAKVRTIRKRRGLTQGELAEQVDLYAQSIQRLEKGVVSPSVDLLDRVLEPMGYTLDIVRIEEVEKEE